MINTTIGDESPLVAGLSSEERSAPPPAVGAGMHGGVRSLTTPAAHGTKVVAQLWDVPIEVAHPDRVDPRHLHAVVSAHLDGEGIDGHRAPTKDYALSPLWERPDGRPGFALRVLGRAITLASIAEEVRLGDQRAVVVWPEASLLDATSLDELRDLAPASSVLVRFCSPMTRRQGPNYLPHPTPEGIMGSWERAAGQVGLVGRCDWRNGAVRLAHLEGQTIPWVGIKGPWRRERPVGFVGEVALVAEPGHRHRLHQLARLATFAGTGAHTTFGMGLTELVAVEEVG